MRVHWSRERWAASAGAAVLTIALPVAIDQGYFRHNAYVLPVLGLVALLVYLGLFVTSETCKSYALALKKRFEKRHRVHGLLIFACAGAFVGMLIGVCFWLALKESRKHIVEMDRLEHPASVASQSNPQINQAGIIKSDIQLIFKESRLFTPERKLTLTREVNDFYQYLSALGFNLPNKVPPLGVGPSVSAGGGFPDTIYAKTITIRSHDVDNLANVRYAYALFIFQTLFDRFQHSPSPGPAHNLAAVWLFSRYYCASYANRKPKINPRSGIAIMENALWDIRRRFGKDFVDRSMFYTFERWEPDLPKEKDFQRFFGVRFLLGEAVVDNLGKQDTYVRTLFAERGLLRDTRPSEQTHTEQP
jgi:hypothetical protein